LKEAYLSHRQVGASEAAYRLNRSLKMKDSNIACIFVTTGFPKNRSVFYKRVKENPAEEIEDEELDEHEINEEETVEEPATYKTVKIDGKDGTYTEAITIIDRYKERPGHLEDLCLGQFAISYVYTTRVPKETTFDEDGCSNEFSNEEIFQVEVSLICYL